MFAAPEQGNSRQQWFTLSSKRDDKIFCDFTRPRYVLPADAASYEQMVEQVAKAESDYAISTCGEGQNWNDGECARRILAALGIVPLKKGGAK